MIVSYGYESLRESQVTANQRWLAIQEGVWVLPYDSIYEYKRTGSGPSWDWKTRKKGTKGGWNPVNQEATDILNADAVPRIGPDPASVYHIEEDTVIRVGNGNGKGNGNGNGPPKWLYPVVGGVALISLIIILASVGGKKKGKKK